MDISGVVLTQKLHVGKKSSSPRIDELSIFLDSLWGIVISVYKLVLASIGTHGIFFPY
jgi:hypothetical protein